MKVQVTEKGVIAIITLASCTALIATGHNGVVSYTMLAVVVGYFGIEIWPIPQITRRKGVK